MFKQNSQILNENQSQVNNLTLNLQNSKIFQKRKQVNLEDLKIPNLSTKPENTRNINTQPQTQSNQQQSFQLQHRQSLLDSSFESQHQTIDTQKQEKQEKYPQKQQYQKPQQKPKKKIIKNFLKSKQAYYQEDQEEEQKSEENYQEIIEKQTMKLMKSFSNLTPDALTQQIKEIYKNTIFTYSVRQSIQNIIKLYQQTPFSRQFRNNPQQQKKSQYICDSNNPQYQQINQNQQENIMNNFLSEYDEDDIYTNGNSEYDTGEDDEEEQKTQDLNSQRDYVPNSINGTNFHNNSNVSAFFEEIPQNNNNNNNNDYLNNEYEDFTDKLENLQNAQYLEDIEDLECQRNQSFENNSSYINTCDSLDGELFSKSNNHIENDWQFQQANSGAQTGDEASFEYNAADFE